MFSDARLKKNVQPLEGALDRLMRLQGVTFEYKDPVAIHELPGTQIGMIAQEVEKVFPDWVDTAPNGMKRVSVHGFEALTVEALRELRKEKDEKLAEVETTAADVSEANAKLRKETDARLAELEKANLQVRDENEKLQKELAGEKETVALLVSRLQVLERQFAQVAADKNQTMAAARLVGARQ